MFSVALACGLRLGEACGLKWDDVDLETGEVHTSVSNCSVSTNDSCCRI